MNTLMKYPRGGAARFDFRVPDGLGHFVYPDWTDAELKAQVYDANGELRLTATVGSTPPLTQGNDYDEQLCPEGGPFVAIEGIELSSFALGVAEAWVYAKVGGVEVLPYPTMLTAFEVVEDGPEGPLYTLVEKVKQEVPGSWPEDVTEEMVRQAIADMSRQIDGYLGECYDVPFPDIGGSPATPPTIEMICRKLAAKKCEEWMGRINAAEKLDLKENALSELMLLVPVEGKPPAVRLPGYSGPLALYQGDLRRSDAEESEDVLDQ